MPERKVQKGTLCTIILPNVVLTGKQRKELEEKVRKVLKGGAVEAGEMSLRGTTNIGVSIFTFIFG